MTLGAKSAEGDLLVIGGAEDKLGKRTVLKEFVERAGGANGRIAVVPTASSLGPEIIEVYAALFTRLGAAEVYGVRPQDRAQASDPELVSELDRATGIFMTGGNQLKLSTVIAGTPFGQAVIEARGRGVTIGGTSAGASIMSSHMVAFGPGRHDSQAADDAGGRRTRAGRPLRDRPALRTAQPLRPAADDRLAEPPAARHGYRRGHRRGDQRGPSTATSCGSSVGVRSR